MQAGILTAGDVDDNLNFPFFQTYLNNTLDSSFGRTLPGVRVGDRVTLKLIGSDRRPLSNAWVRITPQGANQPIVERQAGSDGVFQFFPTLDGAGTATKFQLEIRKADTETGLQTVSLDLDKLYLDRTMEIPIANASGVLPPALDLMLVIDTTGSMQDELNYLTNEFRSIVGTVRAKYPNVSMRFGLIVYRDIGDEYVVRTFDFVTSADDMQKQLAAQYASGGGDTPEAVDQALGTAINATWRPGNVARMLFWVADAPSHPERHAAVLQAIQSARRKSLHIYPLAASGVDDQAEYLMRVAAVLTQGRHLFLTDDSGVGESHALPKIPCNIVTRLDNLMVRVIDSELSGVRVEPTSDQIIRTVGTYDKGVCTSKQ